MTINFFKRNIFLFYGYKIAPNLSKLEHTGCQDVYIFDSWEMAHCRGDLKFLKKNTDIHEHQALWKNTKKGDSSNA